MSARPRIDLDGVSLADEARAPSPMVVAIFRYRTAEGLVLLVPESAEVLVPFAEIEESRLDLATGAVRLVFRPGYVERQGWLRGARVLVGTWTDRFVMSADAFPRRA
jgi:hypothetical protein